MSQNSGFVESSHKCLYQKIMQETKIKSRVYIVLERNLARKSQSKQNLARSQQILQDYILPCNNAQALARA